MDLPAVPATWSSSCRRRDGSAGAAGDLIELLQAAAARPAPLQLLARESGRRLALATRGGSDGNAGGLVQAAGQESLASTTGADQ
ncbi:hypothetical protein AE923_13830 [Xanthomonas arboricola]|nr:hypothetical protein AE923_13830 [Xanthomonas arboricola]